MKSKENAIFAKNNYMLLRCNVEEWAGFPQRVRESLLSTRRMSRITARPGNKSRIYYSYPDGHRRGNLHPLIIDATPSEINTASELPLFNDFCEFEVYENDRLDGTTYIMNIKAADILRITAYDNDHCFLYVHHNEVDVSRYLVRYGLESIYNILIGGSTTTGEDFDWSSYWATLISATVEDAAPTHFQLTFPSARSVAITDFTIADFEIIAMWWTGAVLTLRTYEPVLYGDAPVVTFVKTGGTANVTNNVLGWWLKGGISPTNCMVAYQPVGVDTLALSKINLNNPGTNNARAGADPDHDAVNGWKFNGSSHYLLSGLVPDNDQSWSMIIKYSDFTEGTDYISGIWEGAGKEFGLIVNGPSSKWIMGSNGKYAYTGNDAPWAGIIAVAGNRIYWNGVEIGGAYNTYPIEAGSGNITLELPIGAKNEVTLGIRAFFDGNIQAYAVYDKQLSAPEILALTQEMLTLTNYRRTVVAHVKMEFGGLIHFNMGTFTGQDASDPDIIETFAPTGVLDMEEWLDACVSAGMKYVGFTSKHYDGFALWPTAQCVAGEDPYSIAQTAYYAANGNPDLVAQFTAGARTRGLKVGLYYNMHDSTWESRAKATPATATATYLAYVSGQITELLTNYGDIDFLWLDAWPAPYVGFAYVPYATIYALVKGLQPGCVLIANTHTHPSITTEIEVYEYSIDGDIAAGNIRLSEEVKTPRLDGQWFAFPAADQTAAAFKTSTVIAAEVAQCNTRNGSYFLAVTPKGDGHIPEALLTILEELGAD